MTRDDLNRQLLQTVAKATNILVVGANIGAATSVGKNCAVAQILIPPVDGTKIYSNSSVQGPVLGNMLHIHELRN